MKILINHLGYGPKHNKHAVLQGQDLSPSSVGTLELCSWSESDNTTVIQSFAWQGADQIEAWQTGLATRVEFSDFSTPGHYYFRDAQSGVRSEVFEIHTEMKLENWISEILFYFKSQRSTGKYDRADREAPLFADSEQAKNRPGFTKDVHGGWYDASGDMSKYLTHLSYGNFFNPQQTPLVVWALLEVFDKLEMVSSDVRFGKLRERLLDEATHGADFLVRMQDPEGFFYQVLFDQWSKDPKRRTLCSFKTQKGEMLPQIQASFRAGGGMSIAALAKASRAPERGDFANQRYLDTAIEAFEHLLENNRKYLPDGKENLIDDYCSLLAGIELFKSTSDEDYLTFARGRIDAILNMVQSDDVAQTWLAINRDANRPYHHASDAGLPLIALMQYTQIETDPVRIQKAQEALKSLLESQMAWNTTSYNPFGLAKQYTQNSLGERKMAYFMPHLNETGYWWQGENARLASLSCAWNRAAKYFKDDEFLAQELKKNAISQLHWICGLNPFDVCMWHGHGRNNVYYQEGYPNAPGGVCNGITSGYENEDQIDFAPTSPEDRLDPTVRWRWREQWIPHGAWFLLALVEQ